MSSSMFEEYQGINPRDGVVAAAQVVRDGVQRLSQITGGTAVMRKVRGGSMIYSEIQLHGKHAKVGDYIVADYGNTFLVVEKKLFESTYKHKGPLRVQPSVRL